MSQFWAKRGQIIAGPFDSRQAALDKFRAAYPFNGPDYMARAKRNQILTGYGAFGPSSDMRWDDAIETEKEG